MIEVNTFLFYTMLSNYLSWFERKETKYIGYVNSTINSTVIVLLEGYSLDIITKLYVGYLLYDTISIMNNPEEYKKNLRLQFIGHNVLCMFCIYLNWHNTHAEFTRNIFLVERTLPLMNLSWFCRYYKINNLYVDVLKSASFLLYTYYRVYWFALLIYSNFIDGMDYKIQLISWCIYAMNIMWYFDIVRNLKKALLNENIEI